MNQPITFIIGRDACNGDNGGPLVARIGSGRTSIMYLYGVSSFGSNSCDGRSPGDKCHKTFFFPITALYQYPKVFLYFQPSLVFAH